MPNKYGQIYQLLFFVLLESAFLKMKRKKTSITKFSKPEILSLLKRKMFKAGRVSKNSRTKY
jgi:hypothetical protein